jgi:hypothetical protein
MGAKFSINVYSFSFLSRKKIKKTSEKNEFSSFDIREVRFRGVEKAQKPECPSGQFFRKSK